MPPMCKHAEAVQSHWLDRSDLRLCLAPLLLVLLRVDPRRLMHRCMKPVMARTESTHLTLPNLTI